jgi:hypothetical protein
MEDTCIGYRADDGRIREITESPTRVFVSPADGLESDLSGLTVLWVATLVIYRVDLKFLVV